MSKQPPLHVVILAAGKGSRMRSAIPKVLHQVAGEPLLGHVLDAALALKPAKVHIVVGHEKESVIEHFKDHSQAKLINWVEQTEQLGTGHAVDQALPSIGSDIENGAHVLMLTADVPLIQSNTLETLCAQMRSHTLAVLTAFVDDPFGLGRMVRDDTNAITGIVEQKDASAEIREINEINSGILCAHGEQLKLWLSQVGNQNAQGEYYLTDIVALAYQSGNPIATIQPNNNAEITGINSRSQLAQAERAYQAKQAERLMEAGVTIIDPARIDIRGDVQIGQDTIIDINVVIQGPTTIGTNVSIAPNCVITSSTLDDNVAVHPNTVIENAILGKGVNVGPFARLRPGTQLSEGVKIGNFVETKNAQLAAGAKVNHLSYVGDATVGTNTNIGAGVITCNYDGANKHKTVIGDDVFVGSDCQLIAPVTIADGATIGAGSTISNDVDAKQLAISRSKQRQINNWRRPSKIHKKVKPIKKPSNK